VIRRVRWGLARGRGMGSCWTTRTNWPSGTYGGKLTREAPPSPHEYAGACRLRVTGDAMRTIQSSRRR